MILYRDHLILVAELKNDLEFKTLYGAPEILELVFIYISLTTI